MDQIELLSRNGTLRTILNRHSVRSFADRDVPEESIETILHAANLAPSAHNQQSWRFVVLRGAKKQALAGLVSGRAPDFQRPASALLRMAARSISSAPAVVAVANTGELMRRGPALFEVDRRQAADFFRVMEIQSSAAAVENMLLAAASLGLGTVWLGILIMIQADVLRFLGEPEGEFMAVVPLGYPSRPSPGPKKRSLEACVKRME